MKKIIIILCALFIAQVSYAQTAVNKDGSIKFRGNVAIYVDCKFYTFKNGRFVKSVDDDAAKTLKTALRAMAMEKFQNIAFGIVNRDDDANRQVQALIEENKLEDYLDGVSARAKNQGADYLYIVEGVTYSENDAASQWLISTRLLNVENNLGYHYFYISEPMALKNAEQIRKASSKMIHEMSVSLEQNLMNLFPEQYYISQAKGKELTLGAYQPNGRILPSDLFYAFKFQKENLQIGDASTPIQVLENVAICENPTAKNGLLTVKADNKIPSGSDIVLFRNVPQPIFQGLNQMTITFFGLSNDDKSYDGMIKWRINNAMYSAITRHVGLQLIEQEHLPSLKGERELQKGEDFIDGHVVQQLKSIGAMYLLKLEDYHRNGSQISMKISLISIEQNMILRTIDVVSSIDNIENEMYKQICERIAYPCTVKVLDKKNIEITSTLSLTDKDNYILELTKAVQNPRTGEVSYSVSNVCTLNFVTYKGNKCVMSINKVFSKEDLKNIENNSSIGFVTIRVDGGNIKSDISSQSDVQQKAKKEENKKKTKETFKALGRALLESSSIEVHGN